MISSFIGFGGDITHYVRYVFVARIIRLCVHWLGRDSAHSVFIRARVQKSAFVRGKCMYLCARVLNLWERVVLTGLLFLYFFFASHARAFSAARLQWVIC